MLRRKFVFGLVGCFAAPAIVKASSLMGIKAIKPSYWESPPEFYSYDIPLEKSLGMFDLPHGNHKLALEKLESMVQQGLVVRSNTGVWVKNGDPHQFIIDESI